MHEIQFIKGSFVLWPTGLLVASLPKRTMKAQFPKPNILVLQKCVLGMFVGI